MSLRQLYGKIGRAGVVGLARSARAILPGKVMAILRENTSLVGKLDYGPHPIWLTIESTREYGARLHSCASEPETVQWIEGFVQEGDVLLDIGANIGAYSLVAAKATGGKATIYAFEPAFANYSQMCRNIHLNGCAKSIVPLPVVLSDRTELGSFNYNNLVAGGSLHAYGEPVDFKGDVFEPVFQHTSISYRLDDFIRQFQVPAPNHIKIDVDGIEGSILKGAPETLANPSLRSMLIEAEPQRPETQELLETMKDAGFYLQAKHEHTFTDLAGAQTRAYNYIFVRR